MPHQCVRCNTFYDDGAEEILRGCSCGGKLFFYIKREQLEESKTEIEQSITPKDRELIEQDVYDLVGDQIDTDKPVVLDIESVRILKPGQYELDLVHLFRGEPLIYKLEEGRYVIDLVESFNQLVKKRKENR